MAIEFDIQVRNGRVKITVGGGQTNTGNASDQGGSSPGNPSTNTGGGGPDGGSGSGRGGPVIIGPIVVDGLSLQSGTQGQSGQGGSSPGNPSTNTGGGGPLGPLGGSSPGNPSTNTGGAGPGSCASGPGCPVIIGPIVISGCSGHVHRPSRAIGRPEMAPVKPAGRRECQRAHRHVQHAMPVRDGLVLGRGSRFDQRLPRSPCRSGWKPYLDSSISRNQGTGTGAAVESCGGLQRGPDPSVRSTSRAQ